MADENDKDEQKGSQVYMTLEEEQKAQNKINNRALEEEQKTQNEINNRAKESLLRLSSELKNFKSFSKQKCINILITNLDAFKRLLDEHKKANGFDQLFTSVNNFSAEVLELNDDNKSTHFEVFQLCTKYCNDWEAWLDREYPSKVKNCLTRLVDTLKEYITTLVASIIDCCWCLCYCWRTSSRSTLESRSTDDLSETIVETTMRGAFLQNFIFFKPHQYTDLHDLMTINNVERKELETEEHNGQINSDTPPVIS